MYPALPPPPFFFCQQRGKSDPKVARKEGRIIGPYDGPMAKGPLQSKQPRQLWVHEKCALYRWVDARVFVRATGMIRLSRMAIWSL